MQDVTLPRRRRRKLYAILAAALVVPAVAVAAFVIYTGVEGSGSGTYEASETRVALTITGTSSPSLRPNTTNAMSVEVRNNNPSQAHTLTALSGTFTTSPAECKDHLRLDVPASILTSYPAGATVAKSVDIVALSTTPTSCAGGTWSVSFSGTTSP
jgi:hypothetical protein